jgi:hypothetical protein
VVDPEQPVALVEPDQRDEGRVVAVVADVVVAVGNTRSPHARITEYSNPGGTTTSSMTS